MLGAGPRNRLITFQRGTPVGDDYTSESDLTWAELAKAFARVTFGSGQERREAAQEGGSQAATFECNWTPTLNGVRIKDRILFAGSAWDITSCAPIGLNKDIHFTATRSA